MKKLLDQKYIDFVTNKVNYKYIEASTNGNYNVNTDGYYDYTPNQYDRPRKIAIWFVELKYGSTLNDDFYKKLFEVVKNAAKSKNQKETLKNELIDLVNSTTIGDKENGHLLRYAWYFYEGKPFSDKQDIFGNNTEYNGSNCLKQLGEIIIPFVKNWDNDSVELKKFKDYNNDYSNKIRKEFEKIKRDSVTANAVPLKGIRILISESTLHQDIKNEIFENLSDKYQDLQEIVEQGLIVHDDTLFDAIGDEHNWRKHFLDHLDRFPYNIMTEHYTILYNGVKLTSEEKNLLKIKIRTNKYNL